MPCGEIINYGHGTGCIFSVCILTTTDPKARTQNTILFIVEMPLHFGLVRKADSPSHYNQQQTLRAGATLCLCCPGNTDCSAARAETRTRARVLWRPVDPLPGNLSIHRNGNSVFYFRAVLVRPYSLPLSPLPSPSSATVQEVQAGAALQGQFCSGLDAAGRTAAVQPYRMTIYWVEPTCRMPDELKGASGFCWAAGRRVVQELCLTGLWDRESLFGLTHHRLV